MNRVLLLGLDGVGFPMLEPAFEAGHMPRLKALLERGASGVLTSTVPPYTPPGWTSIFTGVNPGKHGIFGFTLGNVQRRDGLVRLDRVKAPALWNVANAQGKHVGLFNIPMTFPPPPVDGFAVSGMLTPEGGGATPEGFTHPEELAGKLIATAGDYEIDIDVNYDEDWKSSAIIDRLSKNLELKRKALGYLLDNHGDVPILFAVIESPDRLMHVHYKYIDPTCEHYERPEAAAIRDRAWSFFDEMDEMMGDLIDWAGDDGFIITMSDHGFGPKEKVVNVNVVLREAGLLSVRGAGTVAQTAGARKLARRIKKVIPKAAYRRAKGAAQSTIDWSKTKAFASPNPQQGIYINLKGREPNGIVEEADYERVRNEVVQAFGDLEDPDDGGPVLDLMYKREDVIEDRKLPRRPTCSRSVVTTRTSCPTVSSLRASSPTIASCRAASITWTGSSGSRGRASSRSRD
ncbi:MAG: alkaline phosphatase family protein [Actinomycetota bacterium]|nr:alkaline phosphatase family protein [Actinomycetota bacterium]